MARTGDHQINVEAGMLWFLGAFGLLAAGTARGGEIAVYVSPRGNDSWSGRLVQPNPQK